MVMQACEFEEVILPKPHATTAYFCRLKWWENDNGQGTQ